MLLVVVSKSARRRIIAAWGCVLALFLILTFIRGPLGGYFPVGARLKPVQRVDSAEPKIALTFNLSWGEKNPPAILDALKQTGVHATFFVSGPWASSHPDLMKRMVAEGHEVQNLGFWYEDMRKSSREKIIESARRTNEVIKQFTQKNTRYFRPPNGLYDDKVISAVLEVNCNTVLWSLDSQDWRKSTPETLEKRVAGKARSGDIVLLSANDNAEATPLALPGMIEALKQKGLQCVTLSELLSSVSR